MRKLYAFLTMYSLWCNVFAQALLNNNGADIYVKDGGFVIVKTNSLYNNQLIGAGVIDNAGTIVIEGNITNDGNINATGDTIRLSGNWINNSAYSGNDSWVELNGGAQQITGTSVTTFNNLNLLGGSVVKTQTLDAVTSGVLVLNNAELATDAYEMLVSNTNTNAIVWNNGFVSSINMGKLSRATNSTSAYIYPVGSPSYNNPPSIFRPIEYAPTASIAKTYGAMVVKGDATNDSYNINTLDDVLCKVNPNFYHRLYHSFGNDATSVKMFFDPISDGDWTDQGHWDSPNRWNYNGISSAGNGLGFSTVSVGGVTDFQPEPFALARKRFTVNAGPDVSINLGESTTFNPTIGTSFISTIGWTPPANLTCLNCETPDASPSSTTQYTITVTDNVGCIAADSLIVTVNNPELLIPTGFSPNGDGVNDVFRTLNKNIQKFNLEVFNRWGERVFQTSDPLEGWDGVFKGIEQELGTYVWKCDYVFMGSEKPQTAKGNVTLVR